MPFAKLRQDYTPLPSPSPAPPLTAALDGVVPTRSPARALQQHLVQRTGPLAHTDLQKWSPRRSLVLIVSASAALWMAILMMAAEAGKLVA